jgi:hypothetical protein
MNMAHDIAAGFAVHCEFACGKGRPSRSGGQA